MLSDIACTMIGIDEKSYFVASWKKTRPLGVMSTAVRGDVVLTWEKVLSADGYIVYEASSSQKYRFVSKTKTVGLVLKGRERGETYRYYVKAYWVNKSGKTIYSKPSKTVSVHVPQKGVSTIKNFLQVAISPVGSTMYVWGGGWNREDTAAGAQARQLGLSKRWRTFSKNKDSGYDYKQYRYRIHDGLDCSGYVGWCVYNILNVRNKQPGYVLSASKQAKKFAQDGLGTYRNASKVINYKPGDIMSSTCSCCGHVWIVVGACADGSVVLVHASPPGVQINGTTTPDGKKNSQAYYLAKKYMKKYYSSWYRRFLDVSRGPTYLSHYGQMRWTTSGEHVVLSDPDHFYKKDARQILKELFETVHS